jgi:glycosyltransferase involved in cell wall biosynthesis
VGTLLEEMEGVARRRIAVVPNFLDEEAFRAPSPAERRALAGSLRLEGAGPTIGIVANLLPIKDHASLLRAAAELLPGHAGLRVVLVGDGGCRGELERLAGELGIAGAVVFAGRRPHLPNLHHLFDVSVLCSRSEGLPNSVLEAMAAGRPVVATNVGAVADAVVEGETGLLVPPGDPAALAAALDGLLSDPARARRLGEAGAARARGVYSPEAALGALERLYVELARRGRGEGTTDERRRAAQRARASTRG